MKKIPEFVAQYLWDVPVSSLDPSEKYYFVIERILEYGDFEALEWMNNTYKKDQIEEVLITSKKISPKTGNFFAIYYNIPREELLCIQKPFTQKQNRF
jgi:hypothetical protein